MQDALSASHPRGPGPALILLAAACAFGATDARAQDGFRPPFNPPSYAEFGTTLQVRKSFMEHPCASGCLVASAPEGTSPGLLLDVSKLTGQDGSAAVGVALDHHRPHALRVALDGRDWVSFLCNGATVTLEPGGALKEGYRLQVWRDGKLDADEEATGNRELPSPGHEAMSQPMRLEVVAGPEPALALVHGGTRVLIRPRDGAHAARPVHLHLRAEGVPEFAVTDVRPLGAQ